jgi:hypothetical protein
MKIVDAILLSLLACAVLCSGCSQEPDYSGYNKKFPVSLSDEDGFGFKNPEGNISCGENKMSISVDELHKVLPVVDEYIANVKKENKDNFYIEYEELYIVDDRTEKILRFSEKGDFLYDIGVKRLSKRTDKDDGEYNYLRRIYMVNVMSNEPLPAPFFGKDEKSFHLQIDRKTMRVVKELHFQ